MFGQKVGGRCLINNGVASKSAGIRIGFGKRVQGIKSSQHGEKNGRQEKVHFRDVNQIVSKGDSSWMWVQIIWVIKMSYKNVAKTAKYTNNSIVTKTGRQMQTPTMLWTPIGRPHRKVRCIRTPTAEVGIQRHHPRWSGRHACWASWAVWARPSCSRTCCIEKWRCCCGCGWIVRRPKPHTFVPQLRPSPVQKVAA